MGEAEGQGTEHGGETKVISRGGGPGGVTSACPRALNSPAGPEDLQGQGGKPGLLLTTLTAPRALPR